VDGAARVHVGFLARGLVDPVAAVHEFAQHAGTIFTKGRCDPRAHSEVGELENQIDFATESRKIIPIFRVPGGEIRFRLDGPIHVRNHHVDRDSMLEPNLPRHNESDGTRSEPGLLPTRAWNFQWRANPARSFGSSSPRNRFGCIGASASDASVTAFGPSSGLRLHGDAAARSTAGPSEGPRRGKGRVAAPTRTFGRRFIHAPGRPRPIAFPVATNPAQRSLRCAEMSSGRSGASTAPQLFHLRAGLARCKFDVNAHTTTVAMREWLKTSS